MTCFGSKLDTHELVALGVVDEVFFVENLT